MTLAHSIGFKKARTFVYKHGPKVLKAGVALSAKLYPSKTLAWAEDLFMKPQRYPRSKREAQILGQATRHDLIVEGQRITYWEWGTGPRVLLVHGWSGRGAQLMAYVPLLLEAGFSVITFDAPGHGDSEGNRSSIFAFKAAILALAKQLGPFAAAISHSMGGAALALSIAEHLPVARVVMLAPPSSLVRATELFAKKIGLSATQLQTFQKRLEKRFDCRLEQLNLTQLAPHFTQPLLVIHDLDDPDVSWASGERIANAWPNSHLVTTKGLGHHRILYHTTVLTHAMDFLQHGHGPRLDSPMMPHLLSRGPV